MIKNIFLVLAVLHAATLVIVFYLMLFDLISLNYYQGLALFPIAILAVIFIAAYFGIKNEEGSV